MKDYSEWNIYDVEKSIKNGDIVDYLDFLLRTKGEDAVIENLKVSGYFVSYLEWFNIEKKTRDDVECFIKTKLSKKYDKIVLLKKEAKLLADKRNQISYDLDQILIKYCINENILIDGAVALLDKIKEEFDVSVAQQNISTKEYVIFSLGAILKALAHMQQKEGDIKQEVSSDIMQEILNKANLLREFNEMIMAWMFGNVLIIVDSDGMFIKEDDKIIAESVNLQRVISGMHYFDVKDMKELKGEINRLQGRNRVRVYEEVLRNKVKEYFYSTHFQEKYLGIALELWIKMYTSFADLAYQNENSNYIEISKEQIESRLSTVGIEKAVTSSILKYITYTKESKDLFDSFLISKNGYYLFIPKAYLFIDASRAMISIFGKNNEANIEKKGVQFEKHIASLIEDNTNIQFITNIEAIENGEKYEIDLVFILDDIAFFCECKTQLQNENIRGYYRNLQELDWYLHKFERNFDFFDNTLKGNEIIRTKFRNKGTDYEKVKSKIKIFIGNVYYPIVKKDDIFITDETRIYTYMKRIPSSVYAMNDKKCIIYKLFPEFYEGHPNAQQLISCLENKAREIEIAKKRIKLWDNHSTKSVGISIERFVEDYQSNYINYLNPNEYVIV